MRLNYLLYKKYTVRAYTIVSSVSEWKAVYMRGTEEPFFPPENTLSS